MKKEEAKELPKMNNYRELLDYVEKNYSNNIAYKYKENLEEKPVKYVEKKYSQVVKDVKALSTALLDLGLKGKRVALIGENRYEWCISYLAVTCGGMIIAPLDKALPDKEISSLIKRSEVDAVIYEKKHDELFKKLKNDNEVNLNKLICIDANEDDSEVIKFEDLLEKGRKLIKEKSKLYDKVEIDSDAMSIMLFTSGTTSAAKIVMLSQNNVCSNMYAYQTHFRIRQDDILLSFLPIHHTFESSITILYGFYSGATIAFCDGLRYIQANLKEYEVSIFVAVPLVLETMYKKITKAIADQGKTKLIKVEAKRS